MSGEACCSHGTTTDKHCILCCGKFDECPICKKTLERQDKKLYLKVKDYNGYDEYYLKVVNPGTPTWKNQTWKNILNGVEFVLDQKFLDNKKKLVGIKMEFEIVDKVPEDFE